MERGLLSSDRLAELQDDVVWMYLYQDFSGDAADRAAQRVAIRFGITTWPQHVLVDPFTLEVLADTGRSLASFRSAVAGVSVAPQPGVTPRALRAADALAARLESGEVPVDEARRLLDHADVVVRYRAVERLRDAAPEAVVAAAPRLLDVAHDQTRFLVCQVLAAAGNASVHAQLEALLQQPTGSRNPNVLRIHAARALARCGDAGSVAALAPCATSGDYNNALTGVAVDAVVALAARHGDARDDAERTLLDAFPEPPDTAAAEREQRRCRAAAAKVHRALQAVTEREEPFPARYDAAARRALMRRWR